MGHRIRDTSYRRIPTRAEPSPFELRYDATADGLCAGDCRLHRAHIYILCYGRPVMVRDRDYLPGEQTRGYPISHYVGYTTQFPIDRVRQHGARSAHFIAAIRPGTMADERRAKQSESCPRCGQSL